LRRFHPPGCTERRPAQHRRLTAAAAASDVAAASAAAACWQLAESRAAPSADFSEDFQKSATSSSAKLI